jgi:S-adenosylmethionine:tRNA ribosyltransferase-isomerase
MNLNIDDFHFDLPEDLIARHPLAKRSDSRLLCLDKTNGNVFHRQFTDIVDLVGPNDLLVMNNTKVIPARLFAQKSTGGQVEILMERILDSKRMLALLRASKSPKLNEKLICSPSVCLTVVARHGLFYELENIENETSMLDIIEAIGHVPLPPYLKRREDEHDKDRYQTIYAEHKGSVAAPTAGLHFDEDVMQKLRDKNVEIGYLTLHIGFGTFAPIRVTDISEHKMHAEYFNISQGLCEQIKRTKACGKRVIAVGTTSLRALETVCKKGEIRPYQGETDIFIYPGHTFRSADALITNLHLPRSTLLMLVSAFGGHENVMHAYKQAINNAYRFYSYGDAMWIACCQSR